MRITKLAAASAALLVAMPAFSQKWIADAPVPPHLSSRTFLKPDTVAVYQKKAEELVGRWGILQPGGIVELTADRPASFSVGNVPVTQVTLSETDPVYRSLVSSSAGINAAVPFLNLSLSANQKATIEVTDVAQFLVSKLPEPADWGKNAANPGAGKPRLVYVGAAMLSLAETTKLNKKGVIGSFFSGISLGAGANYEEDVSSKVYVLSVAIYEPSCRLLDTCDVPSVSNGNLAPIKEKIKSINLTSNKIENSLK